jgi:hypothetical protein
LWKSYRHHAQVIVSLLEGANPVISFMRLNLMLTMAPALLALQVAQCRLGQ